MKTYYMHTLDDRPAYYSATAGYICISTPGGHVRCGQWLCESLAEIRVEQNASHQQLRKDGFDVRDENRRMGYVRVHVREKGVE